MSSHARLFRCCFYQAPRVATWWLQGVTKLYSVALVVVCRGCHTPCATPPGAQDSRRLAAGHAGEAVCAHSLGATLLCLPQSAALQVLQHNTLVLTFAACGQAQEVATDWPLGMPTKLSAPVRASPFSSAPLSPFGPAPPSPQQRSGGDGSGGGGVASGAKGREGEAGASAAILIPEGGGDAGGKVLPGLSAIWVVHDMHMLDSASCPINAHAKLTLDSDTATVLYPCCPGQRAAGKASAATHAAFWHMPAINGLSL